jgi:Rod binding domain-containing protein
MEAVTLAPRPQATPAQDAQTRKTRHAAQEFEAVLLSTLLDSFGKTFSSLPGGQSKSPAYQSLGTQALATGLAEAGGLGIARFLLRQLLPGKGVTPTSLSTQARNISPAKVFF